MAKYIIDIPDEVSVSEELVPFDMCRPSWYLEAYKKGKADTEDEVWEFVMKCLKMDGSDFYKIFDSCDVLCLTNLSYQEAKDKYDEWRKQKEEIRIGDEVYDHTISGTGIVTNVENKNMVGIMWDDGSVNDSVFVEDLRKTGRHFPEVAELLKKIRGEGQ